MAGVWLILKIWFKWTNIYIKCLYIHKKRDGDRDGWVCLVLKRKENGGKNKQEKQKTNQPTRI